MLRDNGTRALPTTSQPTPDDDAEQIGVRAELARIGRRWSASLTRLVELAADLDESGEWALDGSPTCAHWIAGVLDIEVSTAREWLRIGRALRKLPSTAAAFGNGTVSYSKVRSLTRLATADNEDELLEIASRTAPGKLSTALAAWSARHEDEATRNERHRRERGMRHRVEPDGAVSVTLRLTPEQWAVLGPTIDAEVLRGDGREPEPETTESGEDASGTRRSHVRWASLAQQRVDALIRIVSGGGSTVTTEVILHVRADGCTLDDGTPIAGSVVERLVSQSSLRAMIHDAQAHPINVSGKHRRHTDRQKRVVKERDGQCVDCGATAFLQYDHVPDFDVSGHTLVEETELRCSRCHKNRHARDFATTLDSDDDQ